MDLARAGTLDFSSAITRTVPFDANAINAVLDDLERGGSHLRTVIAVRWLSRWRNCVSSHDDHSG